jgi:hypothetical protein
MIARTGMRRYWRHNGCMGYDVHGSKGGEASELATGQVRPAEG